MEDENATQVRCSSPDGAVGDIIKRADPQFSHRLEVCKCSELGNWVVIGSEPKP